MTKQLLGFLVTATISLSVGVFFNSRNNRIKSPSESDAARVSASERATANQSSDIWSEETTTVKLASRREPIPKGITPQVWEFAEIRAEKLLRFESSPFSEGTIKANMDLQGGELDRLALQLGLDEEASAKMVATVEEDTKANYEASNRFHAKLHNHRQIFTEAIALHEMNQRGLESENLEARENRLAEIEAEIFTNLKLPDWMDPAEMLERQTRDDIRNVYDRSWQQAGEFRETLKSLLPAEERDRLDYGIDLLTENQQRRYGYAWARRVEYDLMLDPAKRRVLFELSLESSEPVTLEQLSTVLTAKHLEQFKLQYSRK